MNTSVIIGILFSLIFLGGIIYLIVKFIRKKFGKSSPSFYKIYNQNGLQFVKKLEELEDNNQTLSVSGPITLYNQMFNTNYKTLDEVESAIGVGGYIDLPENVIYKAEQPKVEQPKTEEKVVEKIEVKEKFNPNNLSHEDWMKRGFTEKQANTILNFKRSLGGSFKDAKTLKRCYGISEEKFKEIEPYLVFE